MWSERTTVPLDEPQDQRVLVVYTSWMRGGLFHLRAFGGGRVQGRACTGGPRPSSLLLTCALVGVDGLFVVKWREVPGRCQ